MRLSLLLSLSLCVRPPYLRPGDTVVILTPSSVVSCDALTPGIDTLRGWGLNVVVDPHACVARDNRAGSPEARAAAFQRAINDPNVRAIFCSRGGYGAVTIADRIDFTPLIASPKWLIGYSDITGFHLAFNQIGIESIHGTHPNDMGDAATVSGLRAALFGGWRNITIATNARCVQGEATGRLIGGNMCLVSQFVGSPHFPDTDGAILFLEDVGEYTYTLDRFVHHLRLAGKLRGIRGVVIGHLTSCAAGWNDVSPEKMLYDFFSELGVPVMFGAPCGHSKPNLPLYLGSQVTLSVGPEQATLSFDSVVSDA